VVSSAQLPAATRPVPPRRDRRAWQGKVAEVGADTRSLGRTSLHALHDLIDGGLDLGEFLRGTDL
jgi:hypothetical protein